MGDFNDILAPEEKHKGNPQPHWLIDGFTKAVKSSGLRNLEMEGYNFTWERSRGTPRWVEAKLNQVLDSNEQSELFRNAKALMVEETRSDHLPAFLRVNGAKWVRIQKRKKFENMWLRESLC